MKRNTLILIISVFIFAGCKTENAGDDPKEVVTQFMDAVSAGDFSKARALSTPESQMVFTLMEMGMKDNKAELKKFDRTKIETGTATISGETATVSVKEKSSGESINVPLKKINGSWKVAFDFTSFLNMATAKAKEKGIVITDSVDKALKEIKLLNIDSIKREMNKGLDTLQKELNKIH
jgi:hypothetical protein